MSWISEAERVAFRSALTRLDVPEPASYGTLLPQVLRRKLLFSGRPGSGPGEGKGITGKTVGNRGE